MALLPIAHNTWREAVRDRWMLVTLLGMSAACGLVFVAERGGPGQGHAVVDLGASLMLVAGNLLAIFLAAQAIPIELEKRTAYVVLAKPVGRLAFLAGKYLGLMAALGASWAAMTLVWLAFAWASGMFKPSLALLSLVAWFQVAVVAAMALMFGAITNRPLAVTYSLSLLLLGQFGTLIREFAISEAPLRPLNYWAGMVVSWVLPHLEIFDLKGVILYGQTVPWTGALWASAYALCLVAACLLTAGAGWGTRELP